MSYLKVFSVALLCAFITSCGDEQTTKEAPAEAATKTEVIVNTPAPPPAPEPKTEVEVKMNTPAGEVKVKTEK